MSEGAAPAEGPTTPPVPLWRRLLPFVLAGGLLVWVLSKVDLDEFVAALSHTNIPLYVAFAVVFTVALLLADAFATAGVYRAVVADVTTMDVFVVRGASYLPSLVNYHVGQAWMTWFVAQNKGASLWRMSGATLVVYATTFGALWAFGLVGGVMAGERVPWLPPTVIGIGVAAVLYMIVVAIKPRFLAQRRLLSPLFELGVGGQLLHFLRRLPHVAVLFAGTWIPFEFFGVHIPPAEAFGLIPVIMLIVALPLTPQGIGTRDVVAVALLASFHPSSDPNVAESAVLASTLSWGVLLTLVQLPLGLALMASAKKRLQGQPAPKA
ncbi:MAG: flippase-like domain-containing protein [Myxococcales bacterium]|nr:flippase-like domain-containing protein [Myxococcales bacterium]